VAGVGVEPRVLVVDRWQLPPVCRTVDEAVRPDPDRLQMDAEAEDDVAVGS